MNNEITLNLEQVLIDAELGESTSLDSALARPFRVLTEKGKKVGRMNHIFFTTGGHSYIFGTLCNSSGGRLLFFPGLSGRKVKWDSTVQSVTNEGMLDHITLEPKLKNWHLTIFVNGKKDKNHLPNRNIVKIQRGLYYWFGMSLEKHTLLEKAMVKHSFSFNIPKGKEDFYSSIINRSKKGAVFHDLLLLDENVKDNEFIHFDVLVDKRFFPRFRKLPHNLAHVPYKPPALKIEEVVPANFPIRAHPVKLPGFRGQILILVSKHKGKLSEEVLIGSAA